MVLSIAPMDRSERGSDEESVGTKFVTRNVEISATLENEASERSHLSGGSSNDQGQANNSRQDASVPDPSNGSTPPPPPPPPTSAPIDQAPVSEFAVDYCSTEQGADDPGCGGIAIDPPDIELTSQCSIHVPLGGDDSDEIQMMFSAEQYDRFPECTNGTAEPDAEPEQADAPAPAPAPVAETEQAVELQERLEEIPATIEEEFASMPIHGGEVAFDEDLMGFGYRGEHTNVFLTTGPQEFTEELLGIEVQVRVEPERFEFDYGDGTVVMTEHPGQSQSPQLANSAGERSQTLTSHVYEETGVFQVQARTWFQGEFRIGEGQWQPIAGQAVIDAEPGEADIWRVDSRHVSGECQDTQQWGCNGPLIIEEGDRPPQIFADQYDQDGAWTGPAPRR